MTNRGDNADTHPPQPVVSDQDTGRTEADRQRLRAACAVLVRWMLDNHEEIRRQVESLEPEQPKP